MHTQRISVFAVSFLLSCSSIILCLAKVQNHILFELRPYTEGQWSLLRSLYGKSGSFIFLNDLKSNTKIDLLVPFNKVLGFKHKLNSIGMDYQFGDQKAQNHWEIRLGNEYGWRRYHSLDETYDWMRSLARLYPDYASLVVAGKSYEERDLLGLKISFGDNEKKAIFLEGGIHAREWISPATTTFIAHQLLTSPQKDVRMIAENFDWYIVPHTNPDGYVYSYTTDRLWRKTRSPQANGCYGVDLNRNYDFHWNETGISGNLCDDTYPGTKPFSEIESRTLAEYISKLKSKLILYVAFHSYRQKLLYPYGYSPKLPQNNVDLRRVYNAAIAGLEKVHGTKYTGGNTYKSMYPASGVSTDWVYAVAGVNYTFVYELCPMKSCTDFGFELPGKWIIPTGEETLISLVEMVKEAANVHIEVTSSGVSSGQNQQTKHQFIHMNLFLFLCLSLLWLIQKLTLRIK